MRTKQKKLYLYHHQISHFSKKLKMNFDFYKYKILSNRISKLENVIFLLSYELLFKKGQFLKKEEKKNSLICAGFLIALGYLL